MITAKQVAEMRARCENLRLATNGLSSIAVVIAEADFSRHVTNDLLGVIEAHDAQLKLLRRAYDHAIDDDWLRQVGKLLAAYDSEQVGLDK